MRKLYTLLAFFFLYLSASAAPVINAIANGAWHVSSTWNLNRDPEINDTVVIPSGRVVTVSNNWDLDGKLFIKVYGTLRFSGGGAKLRINNGSRIWVYAGGLIDGGGSPSQVIQIGSATVFQGNQADIAGPMQADGSSASFSPFNPLPVKFVGFSVTRKNNDVLVQWSTSEELNADRYEIERSYDGSNWNTIALVAAVGNSSVLNNYSFNDRSISARVVYYRIRQIDIDGRLSFTPVKTLRTAAASDVQIAAVNGKVLLQFPAEVKGQVVLQFVGMNGQVVARQTLSNPIGQVVLPTSLTGNYVVALSNGSDLQTARQVRL